MKVESLADVKAAVAEIEQFSINGDSEAAHSREDALYIAVLRHIAKYGTQQAMEMAYLALTTQQLTFERWCA